MEASIPNRLSIGITGVSGFLGSRVAELAVKAGHRVCGFSRRPQDEIAGCAEMREFEPGEIDVSGLDAIIHLAGESAFGLWTPAKKERILASRRDGTRAVVDAIVKARRSCQGSSASDSAPSAPSVLVSASAIGYYGDTGEAVVDETTPAGHDFLANVCKAWEAEALRAETEAGPGFRVAILRFGIILGREGGMIGKLRPLFLMNLGATLGTGRQWLSWIHAGDAANLALLCATDPRARGIYNAVAPTPLRNGEFTQTLARKWHRKAWLRLPEFALRGGLGEFGEMLLESQRVVSRRIPELGYEFHRPEL